MYISGNGCESDVLSEEIKVCESVMLESNHCESLKPLLSIITLLNIL